jgi:heat shock protein HslJ
MRAIILSALTAICFFTACESTRIGSNNEVAPSAADLAALAGTWELNYISGPRIAFEGLYPNKKPSIAFDIAAMRVSGNTSCNSYSGPFTTADGTISLAGPMAVTKMMCADGALGETTYLEMIRKINRFSVSDSNTLSLMIDDVSVMRFAKK